MQIGQIGTQDEVAAAIDGDPRLAAWQVRRAGPGWIELETRRDLARIKAPLLLVLAWPAVWRDPVAVRPHLLRARSGNYALMLVGNDEEFTAAGALALADDADVAALAVPASIERVALALRARAEGSALRQIAAGLELELAQAQHENRLLIETGRALSQQRDMASLLEIILRQARDVTGADAGSVYIVLGDDDATERSLRFMVSQNDSRRIDSKGFTMAVSGSSIVGTCVLSSDVINIPDLYQLDPRGTGNNPWGFVHDRSFDDKYRYQTRSMLTVPMISARHQVIGVIQLINKRARGTIMLETPEDFAERVVPFDDASIAYATSLASQAGIALETARLYDEVKTLFEGFVRASVTAIESRDPTTSGHSERVATLTLGLARATDRLDSGRYKDLRFTADDLTQIEYAALLHDFGKVGVREHVLVKAKKLYEHQRDMVVQRFHLIRRGIEVDSLAKKLDCYLCGHADEVPAIDELAKRSLGELDDMVRWILGANEPTVLEQGGFERISDIAGRVFVDPEGQSRPYLSPEEATALQVMRGSLTREERFEIESHVVHTYNFLRQIPWGRQFRQVPDIAGAHHEKLDGTGYPNQLRGDEIPVPARMMTIADIFDALTAKDRPYKRAMPVERALDILATDVKKGLLDDELFDVFVGARVWDQLKP
ncbi:MAG: GAF domain-containing protein [Myxococcales bacterium]|nr:GAF domain-containing protein [Myxococcales bacterium]MBK7198590.1 GAF domain-containing protein [Myxococcales bacterium]MBP6843263.1 GAF domain-containing protein [Kofleriaceae bacterium]